MFTEFINGNCVTSSRTSLETNLAACKREIYASVNKKWFTTKLIKMP